MAADTKYGVNHQAAYIDVNPGKYGKGEFGGRVRVLYDEKTLTEELEVNDIIKVGRLPKGARVLGATVKSPSLGTTGIVDLGYAASADAVEAADADGFVLQADAGGQAVQAVGAGAAIGKRFEAEVDVQLVVTEVSTAGSTKTIQSWVYYVID